MKIHQMPMGARFRHAGEEYVKTGPMLGSGPQGQKMFPRYLDLEVIDAPVVAKPKPETVARKVVLAAFAEFGEACRELVDEADRERLEQAQRRFLDALDGS